MIIIMIIYNRQLISMYNQKTTQNKRTKKGQQKNKTKQNPTHPKKSQVMSSQIQSR